VVLSCGIGEKLATMRRPGQPIDNSRNTRAQGELTARPHVAILEVGSAVRLEGSMTGSIASVVTTAGPNRRVANPPIAAGFPTGCHSASALIWDTKSGSRSRKMRCVGLA
jgi:hypothetical protein